jgi:hypothetical protein
MLQNSETLGMNRETGLGEMEDEEEFEDIQHYVATMVRPSLPIVSMWEQTKNSQSQNSTKVPVFVKLSNFCTLFVILLNYKWNQLINFY